MHLKIILALSVVTAVNAQNLKTTISEIIVTNPSVQSKLKNYNATKQDITIAQAGYYPKLDLSLGTGYEDTHASTYRVGLPDSISNNRLKVYQNSLTYTQNLFNGFATTQAIKSEEFRRAAASYSYVETVNDISFRMVNTYIEILKNKALLSAAQENIDINAEIFSRVQKLYDSGLTTLSEVNKIESSLSLAKSNFIVQENTLMDFSYKMQRILGRHINSDEIEEPTDYIVLPKTLEEATIFSMQNNPSLLVSNYNIKLAQSEYKAGKAAYYPKVDVEISQSMNKNLSATRGERDQFRAMIYLKYNFFNGFADKANLQKKLSIIHKEVEGKNILRRDVIEGLNLSWAAYDKLSAQLVHLENYKKFSQKTLTLYSKEYDLGRRSLLDLLSAQNDVIASQSQIINTKYSILFSKYRILDAMGILVSTIIKETDDIGLLNPADIEDDELPVNYDKDNDLIIDDKDLCSNSLAGSKVDKYGCKIN